MRDLTIQEMKIKLQHLQTRIHDKTISLEDFKLGINNILETLADLGEAQLAESKIRRNIDSSLIKIKIEYNKLGLSS